MPFEIIEEEINGKIVWRVKNVKKDKIIATKFKSRETAIRQAFNWMRYRKEFPYLEGNFVLGGFYDD